MDTINCEDFHSAGDARNWLLFEDERRGKNRKTTYNFMGQATWSDAAFELFEFEFNCVDSQ